MAKQQLTKEVIKIIIVELNIRIAYYKKYLRNHPTSVNAPKIRVRLYSLKDVIFELTKELSKDWANN